MPKIPSKQLAVKIGLQRGVPLRSMEERLDWADNHPRVHCPGCRREQPDLGKRTTCTFCGCQPIESYAYAKDSPFHPRPFAREPTLYQRVLKRRKAVGR